MARLNICPSASGPLDFTDSCIRSTWSTLAPAFLVIFFLLGRLSPPKFLKSEKWPRNPFKGFTDLREAEALDDDGLGEKKPSERAAEPRPLWLAIVLSVAALFETGAWLAVATYSLAINDDKSDITGAWLGFVTALTWLYAAIAPLVEPSATPNYKLFSLYLVQLSGAALTLVGELLEYIDDLSSKPSTLVLSSQGLNVAVIFGLVLVQFSRPLAYPRSSDEKEEIGKSISPEDYTTLWGWASFSWVSPLIERGTNTTLNEKDVWKLSVTMRARPSFRKFVTIKTEGLWWRLWEANSKDMILDFIGTLLAISFNYCGPFFLKRIIDAIGAQTYVRAYVYALLMFLTQVLKAEADVQHLWYSRRAATRARSELMSSIYDKALKRRDYSGIVKKDGDKEGAGAKEPGKSKDKKKEGGKDDPKSGADIGKIVNLMASDSTRVAMMASALYMLYGAPFEIIIASTMIYQLLGFSGFAGFIALILVWPLNSYMSRRSIRIQKGLLAARDKRMGVLNELLGAIKFIKFFGWEDRWIGRVLDSRKFELKWLIKGRLNNIMFNAVWTTAPILVSVLSFFTYVYIGGNELTVGTAFTAISLFGMLRQPLNTLPTFIIQVLQTHVALRRIEVFLEEDEVDEQVSSIKRDALFKSQGTPGSESAEFGLYRASFKWNAVTENGKESDGKQSEVGKKAWWKFSKKSSPKKNGKDVSPPRDDLESALVTAAGDSIMSTDHAFELQDLSIIFPERQLTLVTGPTASGKTALLLAVMGEMTLVDDGIGKILLNKDSSNVDEFGFTQTLAYAAQAPWLQHLSIKDNILFGSPLDEERYEAVIEACALRPDLDRFEDGDATEIGARGVSLSGGQKARVALARAVYSRARYVLLDDPLSAVDSHTARSLFEKLFLGPLMQNRTVILVTHHVELVLPGANYLVRMLDGRIDLQGTVKELRERGALEAITLDSALEEQEGEKKEEDEKEEEAIAEGADSAPATSAADGTDAKTSKGKKPRKLVKDEEREEGAVKWVIYKTYLKATSYWTWAIISFLIILNQMTGFTERFWIKTWGEAYENGDVSSLLHSFTYFMSSPNEQQTLQMDGIYSHHAPIVHHNSFSTYDLKDRLPRAQENPLFYVGVYGLIGLTSVLINITSMATNFTGALRASRLLFQRLLVTVVRATMRWHDVTPTGRMLNRFSRDIETIDSSLAQSLQAVNSSASGFIASVIVIVAIFPPFLAPAIIIGYFYFNLAIGYLNTGRDLRRMESTNRSPIFSGFGELLEGIITVRAFSAEARFLNNLFSKIDVTLQMWYSFWMTNRWLLLRFDILGALTIFSTTLISLQYASRSPEKEGWAGWAGLCIASAMSFTQNVYWTCRFWTQLELDLNSIERVVEYLELPQEPPGVIENARPPAHWPSSTGPNENKLIEVKDLEIRYAPELPAVLHDVSFQLKARERIGLLGRTGSGKSTLAMSILRFVDPTKGQILVDGIDITSIGVHDLRSRLTFIPQDAALFSGTLRDNLDPFKEHGDEACLDALYRVQMISEAEYTSRRSSRAPSIRNVPREETDATAVASGSGTGSPSGSPSETSTIAEADTDTIKSSSGGTTQTKITLDTEVSAGGLNFSAGQRQLVAMARALLRQSSVIVLDEATSSIDFETDAKIQKTIREEFSNSLLLTIAHRLRTIIDYDRLLVLDAGRVVEFDTPYNLIRREGGVFRGMCLKSGSFSELEEAARSKAELTENKV